MHWQYLDKETIEAYQKDKLWKSEVYYISFLEHLAAQPENKEAHDFARLMIEIRQRYLLDTTFNPDGSVNVLAAPLRLSIWQRVLRYFQSFQRLRKGV